MAGQVFAYIVHKNGVADDTAMELLAAAAKIDAGVPVTAVVTGAGAELDGVCNTLTASYPEVWKIDNPALAYPNAEIIRKALVNILPAGAIVLLSYDTFGLDLGPGLSIKLDSAYVADAVDFEGMDGSRLKVVRQEYSGMVLTCRPGSFQPVDNTAAAGKVVDKSPDAGDLTVKRRYIQVVEAEKGDVDITKSDVLVSVGRGIEDQENIELAEDLAHAMGAVVSCSRPIVDAKWLEKARQVGTSGQTVKPKVYLALGISGSFQHLGGIKGAPFIVAVNKNPKAPIFQVADVGIVEDILEFIPELAEKVKESK